MKTKVIVVTGGVYSSLGKGIVASSIGCILIHGGFKVGMLKLDPYLNTDPGLLSPFQHGEVFITVDGQKTDLDLGHYERFTGLNLTNAATTTSGKLYTELLREELENKFDGATIQVVPHFTNKIIEKIEKSIAALNNPDFLIIEIGGTIGDIEGLPFIEALRIYNARINNNTLFVHCSPLFQLNANDELKTKPTQHSIKSIRNLGISPQMLVLRFKDDINDHDRLKLSWTCDIKQENIFVSKDCKYLYEVPKILYNQGIATSIMNHFNIEKYKFDMSDWDKFLDSIYCHKTITVKVCICGKYTVLNDSYLSLIESLKLAGYKNQVNLEFTLLESSTLDAHNYTKLLSSYDGFIVPDGAGERGVKEMVYVARYCDEHDKPYFGIKLGMQVMMDYLITKVNKSQQKIIVDVNPNNYLGNKLVTLQPQTLAFKIYGEKTVNERHWNNWLFDEAAIALVKDYVTVSGFGQNHEVEIIELKNHKFYIGTLFHPEFTSKPSKLHPLFENFVKYLL